MDVSRMITVIQNTGFPDTDTTTLVEKINDVYHDICGLEPWPFLEKDLNLTFDGVSGLPTNWPTDFRAVMVCVDTVAGTTLMPLRLEEHRRTHIANLSFQSNPLFYYFVGQQLYVYPVPSANTQVNNLLLTYLFVESDLTSGSLSASIALPARYHRAIVDGVISGLYLDEDDEAQSDYYQARMDRRIDRMRRDLWTRHFDRADTIEVLDLDADFYGEVSGGGFGNYGPY